MWKGKAHGRLSSRNSNRENSNVEEDTIQADCLQNRWSKPEIFPQDHQSDLGPEIAGGFLPPDQDLPHPSTAKDLFNESIPCNTHKSTPKQLTHCSLTLSSLFFCSCFLSFRSPSTTLKSDRMVHFWQRSLTGGKVFVTDTEIVRKTNGDPVFPLRFLGIYHGIKEI